ncbi:MAG: OmpA family protein [Bacteroidales bacterium]|nr:OmpA family protein [Bacteroidales bacterium]
MKVKKSIIAVVVLLLVCGGAHGQNFGKKLGTAVKNSAENAATRKAEQKTEEAVNKGIDKATDPNSYKDDKKDDGKSKTSNPSSDSDRENTSSSGTKSQSGSNNEPQSTKSLEMVYAKSDFVPGDKIIFEDDVNSEKAGEFPSQWDVLKGTAEVATINGAKTINIHKNSIITPLMKNMNNYLPDVFTLELDFFLFDPNKHESIFGRIYEFNFFEGKNNDYNNRRIEIWIDIPQHNNQSAKIGWKWKTPGDVQGDWRRGEEELKGLAYEEFHHLAISFNKRALKVYVNGNRTANLPNVARPTTFTIETHTPDNAYFVKNIRLAEGAVPLYDRMMSDGKIISYGITFDIGKSTIKPESMGEINRIVSFMKENPDIKFSVEGHTDNTGTAANNQTLSEARSQAVLAKLVEMGIAKDRLKAAGKGQNSPIADNSTDEGRAKNRRVEFVKF